MTQTNLLRVLPIALVLSVASICVAQDEVPKSLGYADDIQPLLTKYCAGCHNQEDAEGKLSLESYEDLLRGGENGQLFVAGRADASRLIRMLRGDMDPKMPPEDNEAPSAEEIALLVRWIDAGAAGPSGKPMRPKLRVDSKIVKRHDRKLARTSLAVSPNGERTAVGSYQTVQLLETESGKVLHTFDGMSGKVTDLEFSQDGQLLVAASGITGLVGEVTLWNLQTKEVLLHLDAHRDMLYAASLSPDQKRLATGGYDHQIRIWNLATGKLEKTLDGHNGAVYDLDFSPDGSLLVSASADETAKIWHVEKGERLDTLGQPTAEVYACSFSPDGKSVVAAGGDNRIRLWRLISREIPKINPIVFARFGHEGAITRLAFSADGQQLASAAEDKSTKVWHVETMTEIQLWENQDGIVSGLAIDKGQIHLCRLDGAVERLVIGKAANANDGKSGPAVDMVLPPTDLEMHEVVEAEPNNGTDSAMQLTLPAKVTGLVSDEQDGPDEDWFRIQAKAGEQWVLEVDAARSKSTLDSVVEIRDRNGAPVPRAVLQAVRDSYFTFRGKDSTTSGDFRLQNWEEMELNEYLYCQGEVVKLWLYPRGPDSGYIVYPGFGSRHAFFDTTATAHALHEPCYVVQAHSPGTKLIPNGLPVFEIFYENDDDSQRRLGSDSRLTFTAPADGEYFVRLRDVRGFEGESHTYTLAIRQRNPDYKVTLHGANPTVNAGSGKEFEVRTERLDDFNGQIQIQIDNVPAGYDATSPLVIEAGQVRAYGVLYANTDAKELTEEEWKAVKITASAAIGETEVLHDVNSLGVVKLAAASKVTARVVPTDTGAAAPSLDQPWVLQIRPGQTVFAKVVVDRGEFEGRISFGNESSGRNLPHGVYVDNIGLNGLLIVEGKSEREFQITAAKWVTKGTRLFHLVANVEGNQATWPVLLEIVE
jgi:hypothetical protein